MSNIKAGEFGDKHTPNQVLLEAVNGDYKTVIVVGVDEDDYIHTGWSDSSSIYRLGLLQTAIQRIADTQECDE